MCIHRNLSILDNQCNTCSVHRRSWHGPPPFFPNFLFTNLFSIQFLYFFIISSLFPYFNLFVSIFIHSYVNIKLHVSTLYRYYCPQDGLLVSIQYNTIQYNTIQYNTIQCNAMQCNAMQCNAMQYNTIQYNTIHFYSN